MSCLDEMSNCRLAGPAHETKKHGEIVSVYIAVAVQFGIPTSRIVLLRVLTAQTCLKVAEVLLIHIAVAIKVAGHERRAPVGIHGGAGYRVEAHVARITNAVAIVVGLVGV